MVTQAAAELGWSAEPLRFIRSIHLLLAPTVLSSDARHVSMRLPPSVREFRSLISGTKALEEVAKKAADVRTNMARLRELRLAKEAHKRFGRKSRPTTKPQKQNRKSDLGNRRIRDLP
jgi:hypothetical protein